MKKKDKPLPKPPKTPFDRKRAAEDEARHDLLADKMAEAAAMGDLDRFLERELPDSEHARALANMMMGMTGMMPQGMASAQAREEKAAEEPDAQTTDVPPGVREAIRSGDVKGLIGMLQQEHRKRSGGGETPPAAEPGQPAAQPEGLPPQEREVLDRLIALAREHNVSPDWIIERALKLYFEEYKKTGRL